MFVRACVRANARARVCVCFWRDFKNQTLHGETEITTWRQRYKWSRQYNIAPSSFCATPLVNRDRGLLHCSPLTAGSMRCISGRAGRGMFVFQVNVACVSRQCLSHLRVHSMHSDRVGARSGKHTPPKKLNVALCSVVHLAAGAVDGCL